jgi:hypothetical protein
MKHVSFVSATRTQTAGQLSTAMDISAPSWRIMCLRRPLAHAMVVPFAQSSPLTTPKNSCALNPVDAHAVSATKASFFAHGRSGASLPRTRGLAQHDV